jgi:hypothetical protein
MYGGGDYDTRDNGDDVVPFVDINKNLLINNANNL